MWKKNHLQIFAKKKLFVFLFGIWIGIDESAQRCHKDNYVRMLDSFAARKSEVGRSWNS